MRIVSFGEIMLRLSPPSVERLFQSPQLRTYFGGAEANVAASLARLGAESRYVTRVPDNPIGDAALAELRSCGVDVSHVLKGGSRLGLYYVEYGSDVRAMRVVYDRAGSAFGEIDAAAVAWDTVLHGASWLHVSGITPALGAGAAASALSAVQRARALGVKVSFDLNYRVQLWHSRDPKTMITPFAKLADLLIGNAGAITAMLGIGSADARPIDDDVAQEMAHAVHAQMGCARVVVTRRDSRSASTHGWQASLLNGNTGAYHQSRHYQVHVTDRVGGGDAAAAGLLFALASGRGDQDALEFGVAAGAIKLTIPGDFNRATEAEIEKLVQEQR